MTHDISLPTIQLLDFRRLLCCNDMLWGGWLMRIFRSLHGRKSSWFSLLATAHFWIKGWNALYSYGHVIENLSSHLLSDASLSIPICYCKVHCNLVTAIIMKCQDLFTEPFRETWPFLCAVLRSLQMKKKKTKNLPVQSSKRAKQNAK